MQADSAAILTRKLPVYHMLLLLVGGLLGCAAPSPQRIHPTAGIPDPQRRARSQAVGGTVSGPRGGRRMGGQPVSAPDITWSPRESRDFVSLPVAAAMGHLERVRHLLRQGAEVNSDQENGEFQGGLTPLDLAIIGSHYEVVQELLNHGALVNGIPNAERPCTALHVAASHGRLQIAQLLLNAGAKASLNTEDYRDKTPLSYALDGEHLEMARFLRARGALLRRWEGEISGVSHLRYCVEEEREYRRRVQNVLKKRRGTRP